MRLPCKVTLIEGEVMMSEVQQCRQDRELDTAEEGWGRVAFHVEACALLWQNLAGFL